MPETFSRHQLHRNPLVSDHGKHHGTCVTHVPWYISGSLTRSGEESVPGIPGAYPSRNFTYVAKGPLAYDNVVNLDWSIINELLPEQTIYQQQRYKILQLYFFISFWLIFISWGILPPFNTCHSVQIINIQNVFVITRNEASTNKIPEYYYVASVFVTHAYLS